MNSTPAFLDQLGVYCHVPVCISVLCMFVPLSVCAFLLDVVSVASFEVKFLCASFKDLFFVKENQSLVEHTSLLPSSLTRLLCSTLFFFSCFVFFLLCFPVLNINWGYASRPQEGDQAALQESLRYRAVTPPSLSPQIQSCF